jgi:excisionase family DNA binding protein
MESVMQFTNGMETKVERLFKLSEAEQILGLGRTTLYAEIASGRLKSKKIRGARRITESALIEFQWLFDSGGEISDGLQNEKGNLTMKHNDPEQ